MLEWFFEKFILGAWELLVVLLLTFVAIQNSPILGALFAQVTRSFITMITGGTIL